MEPLYLAGDIAENSTLGPSSSSSTFASLQDPRESEKKMQCNRHKARKIFSVNVNGLRVLLALGFCRLLDSFLPGRVVGSVNLREIEPTANR